MANFTKKAIQESFLKLLMERPLSKITVKDIVADCGINRNTFYYYFEDMPKLIESIVEDDAEQMIQSYPTIEKFEDCRMQRSRLRLRKSVRCCIFITRQTGKSMRCTYGKSAIIRSMPTFRLSCKAKVFGKTTFSS